MSKHAKSHGGSRLIKKNTRLVAAVLDQLPKISIHEFHHKMKRPTLYEDIETSHPHNRSFAKLSFKFHCSGLWKMQFLMVWNCKVLMVLEIIGKWFKKHVEAHVGMFDGIHHLDLPQGRKSDAANVAVRRRLLSLLDGHNLSSLYVEGLMHLQRQQRLHVRLSIQLLIYLRLCTLDSKRVKVRLPWKLYNVADFGWMLSVHCQDD